MCEKRYTAFAAMPCGTIEKRLPERFEADFVLFHGGGQFLDDAQGFHSWTAPLSWPPGWDRLRPRRGHSD